MIFSSELSAERLLRNALDLDHAPVCHEVVLRVPGGVDLGEPEQPDDEERKPDPAEEVTPESGLHLQVEPEQDEGDDQDHPWDPSLDDRGQEVLAAAQGDALAIRQELVCVPCHGPSPRPSGAPERTPRGCARPSRVCTAASC